MHLDQSAAQRIADPHRAAPEGDGCRGCGTSCSTNADHMITDPHTFLTTEPCRAVSCIITRWGLENLKSASGISRQHHSCCAATLSAAPWVNSR